MSLPAITVENLSKAYRIGVKEEIPDTFFAAAASWLKAPLANARRLRKLNTFSQNEESDDIIWAVKDVSFDVQEGEVLGIIGRNGAGKSTLLKILSRITEPTSGRAIIRGRISSLLEVGTGFHPELTGRENVYLNGTILGMRKKEIDRKFDEIIDFSGVERFLDTPIKRYSSGMKVRLAFAVAAHLEPEILIIDEVLAVGDQEFQNKCLGKMQDVAGSGKTILFVSHNMASIESLCNKAVELSHGRLINQGDTVDVIGKYLRGDTCSFSSCVNLIDHPGRKNNQEQVLKKIEFINSYGDPVSTVSVGDNVEIRITVNSVQRLPQSALCVNFHDILGTRIMTLHTEYQYPIPIEISESCIIIAHLKDIRLAAGRYDISIYVSSSGEQIDFVNNVASIQVIQTDIWKTGRVLPQKAGVIVPNVEWSQIPS